MRREIRVYPTGDLFDRLAVEAARQRKSLSLTAATLLEAGLPATIEETW